MRLKIKGVAIEKSSLYGNTPLCQGDIRNID